MILQPYVENAINHGLKNLDGDKKLFISLSQKDDWIEIIIEDNGVGRKKAAEIKASSNHNHISRGLDLVQEKINAIQELYGDEILISTHDLINKNGTSEGTKVIISYKKGNYESDHC